MPSPEIYSTLEGQIIVCHVDYQTVAEQGTGAMFLVAHILKENVNLLSPYILVPLKKTKEFLFYT